MRILILDGSALLGHELIVHLSESDEVWALLRGESQGQMMLDGAPDAVRDSLSGKQAGMSIWGTLCAC